MNSLVANRTIYGGVLGRPEHLWVAFGDRATAFQKHCTLWCRYNIFLTQTNGTCHMQVIGSSRKLGNILESFECDFWDVMMILSVHHMFQCLYICVSWLCASTCLLKVCLPFCLNIIAFSNLYVGICLTEAYLCAYLIYCYAELLFSIAFSCCYPISHNSSNIWSIGPISQSVYELIIQILRTCI